jgi:alpha-L-fucosidase
LEQAIRARGMKFFTSLHHENNYTYVKVKPEWAAHNPKYAKLYGCLMPHGEWLQMWLDKSVEVVDKYHPDIIYFDAWMDQIPERYKLDFLAHYFNEAEKRAQDVIVTYKNEDFPRSLAMLDHEMSNPDEIDPIPWLSDYAIGTGYHYSWGYVEGMALRTPREIVHKLIEVVSNNGQFLLNLSPLADGTFPQDQIDIVSNVGVWLWSYGESIYGTRPFTVSYETTAQGQKVHYTTKDKSIYAIFLDWPGQENTVVLKQLRAGNTASKVKSVNVIGLKQLHECTFTQTTDGLTFTIPPDTRIPSDLAQAVKIELE